MRMLRLENPLIRCIHDYSYVLGVTGECKSRENYLFSHYGSLCFIRSLHRDHWDPFDFYPAPRIPEWTKSGLITKTGHDLGLGHESVLTLVEEALLKGGYCFVVLDDFYLENRKAYRKRHYIHSMLVVGIDKNRKRLVLWGYFRGANSDYGVQQVSFDDFVKAFNFDIHLIEDRSQAEFAKWWHQYFELITPNRDALFEFKIEAVRDEVDGFLNCRSSMVQVGNHNKDLSGLDVSFGLAVYDTWGEFVEMMFTGMWHIDFTPIRALWEHKLLMIEKMKFIKSMGFAQIDKNVFEMLIEISRIVRSMSFALNERDWRNSNDGLKFVVGCLKKCRDMECCSYYSILRALQ